MDTRNAMNLRFPTLRLPTDYIRILSTKFARMCLLSFHVLYRIPICDYDCWTKLTYVIDLCKNGWYYKMIHYTLITAKIPGVKEAQVVIQRSDFGLLVLVTDGVPKQYYSNINAQMCFEFSLYK